MGALRDIEGVIFDLDGTLVDSLPDIAGHLNSALADAGLATYSTAEIRRWVGSGAAQLVARATLADRADDVLARFRTHYRSSPYGRTSVFAGLPEVLDELEPKKLAILSNKPQDLVVSIADGLLARWAFLKVVGEKPGIPRKPDPTALLQIVHRLALPPQACVMIGDSEIDIATARAAGMRSIAVTWGLCDRDVLETADHVVTTPAELSRLFH